MNIYDEMIQRLDEECVENIIKTYAGITSELGDIKFAIECHQWLEAYKKYLENIKT